MKEPEMLQTIRDADELIKSLRTRVQELEEKALSWELTARTSGGAFRYVEKENAKLRRIAKLCWEEMNHGLDLPSDVFDAVEKYYAWKKKQKANAQQA